MYTAGETVLKEIISNKWPGGAVGPGVLVKTDCGLFAFLALAGWQLLLCYDLTLSRLSDLSKNTF